MTQKSVEKKQLKKLIACFGDKGFRTKCKGVPVNSKNIRVLVAMSDIEGKTTCLQIQKTTGLTYTMVRKALIKWVTLRMVSHIKGSEKYSLNADIKQKIMDYLSNEQFEPKKLLKSLEIEVLTDTPKVDIALQMEKCPRLKELNLSQYDTAVLIAIKTGIKRPVLIVLSTELPQRQVETSLINLLAKKIIVHERKRGHYSLSEKTEQFLRGEIGVDSFDVDLKSLVETEFNLTSIQKEQFEKLMSVDFSQLNVLVNRNEIATLVVVSMLSRALTRIKIQKLLGFSTSQIQKALKKLVDLKLLHQPDKGKYVTTQEISTLIKNYMENQHSQAVSLLIDIRAIRLKREDTNVLVGILKDLGPKRISKSVNLYASTVSRVISRLKKLQFVDQLASHEPWFLTKISEKYLRQLIESENSNNLSAEDLQLIKTKLAEGLRNRSIEVKKKTTQKRRKNATRIKKKKTKPKTNNPEKILSKFQRLQQFLNQGDWNALELICTRKLNGVKHIVFGLVDLGVPEIKVHVPNPRNSISKLRKEGLIKNECVEILRPTDLGLSILSLKNNCTKT